MTVRVGVDLDGVVFDFASSLQHYLVVECGWSAEDCPPPQTWDFGPSWGLDGDSFLTACHDAADAGVLFAIGDPFPGAIDAVQRLYEVGCEVHLVTARGFGSTPAASERNTRTWLERHGVPFDSLTFSKDKTVVPTDVFIDDHPDNYEQLRAAGVDAYLALRPWNTDAPAREHATANNRAVAGMRHFADLVLEHHLTEAAA